MTIADKEPDDGKSEAVFEEDEATLQSLLHKIKTHHTVLSVCSCPLAHEAPRYFSRYLAFWIPQKKMFFFGCRTAPGFCLLFPFIFTLGLLVHLKQWKWKVNPISEFWFQWWIWFEVLLAVAWHGFCIYSSAPGSACTSILSENFPEVLIWGNFQA